MKYKFLLFLICIILCGCSASYKLEIKNGVFKEKINVSYLNNSQLNYFKDNKLYAIMNGASDFVEYNKKINGNSVTLSHNYKGLDYRFSTVLKTCFSAYNILDEDDYYLISTSKGIKCAVEEDRVILDKLDVVIKTNHVVKENNANSNNKFKNIWHFDKNNYNDGNIYMKIYKNKYVSNYNNEVIITITIILLLAIIISVGLFITFRKVKKASKF